MPALSTVLAAAGYALAIAAVLHLAAKTTSQWLLACLVTSGLYVAVALQLDLRPSPSPLIDGLRWGLLAAALFSFFRYRRARRRP